MIKQINNNKILIISHLADIDGMGSIILGKFYFKEFDYLLADNNYDFDLETDINAVSALEKKLDNPINIIKITTIII